MACIVAVRRGERRGDENDDVGVVTGVGGVKKGGRGKTGFKDPFRVLNEGPLEESG